MPIDLKNGPFSDFSKIRFLLIATRVINITFETQHSNEMAMKKCVSLILFILAALNSHVSLGQKSRMSKSFQGDVIRYRAGTGTYSMKSKYSTPLYKGYEISLGLNQSSLRSGIPQLDKLKMTYLGTNLGFVVASSYAKLKTTLGYYESEPSVPYTMNMMQATVCGGVYPLRFLRAKYRTLEPYAVIGFAYQHTWFYGTYLPNLDTTSPRYNYSSTSEPSVGKTGVTQLNLGLGLEYQLMSYKIVFIHLFAEMNYGVSILGTASNKVLSGTVPINPSMITVGMNFGVIK